MSCETPTSRRQRSLGLKSNSPTKRSSAQNVGETFLRNSSTSSMGEASTTWTSVPPLETKFTVSVMDSGPAIEHMMSFPVLCVDTCLLYTSPSPRDRTRSRMPSSA
eukprot:TRINITY_DN9324_c0_g1_i1.p1 TRINITY_DN9324_c0_g1~~TRINITY_DN9324_c0_g1_i1.p1  ORF type:complete len:106 (-),score=11.91 TRINITY_DN9324_c0_g1_i1:46-363(-)